MAGGAFTGLALVALAASLLSCGGHGGTAAQPGAAGSQNRPLQADASSVDALSICDGQKPTGATTLVRYEVSTVGGVLAWLRGRLSKQAAGAMGANQQIAALPGDLAVAVCVYLGSFPSPQPPSAANGDAAIFVFPKGGGPVLITSGPYSAVAANGVTPSAAKQVG